MHVNVHILAVKINCLGVANGVGLVININIKVLRNLNRVINRQIAVSNQNLKNIKHIVLSEIRSGK